MIIRNVLLKGNIMKKTKAISMLILTLLSGMAVFFISACDGASTGGVRYTVKGDHAVVSGCSKAIAQVTIQPEYEGVPVTEMVMSSKKGSVPVTAAQSLCKLMVCQMKSKPDMSHWSPSLTKYALP